jgi:hypothetical protein
MEKLSVGQQGGALVMQGDFLYDYWPSDTSSQ